MANGHGGARAGAGRKSLKFGFREWCRKIVMDKEVQAEIMRECRCDPNFALKVAEHGFGRPGQALDVNVTNQKDERRIVLHDGTVIPTGDAVVPAPSGHQ